MNIEDLEMVENVEKLNPHVLRVTLDKMENGMWFIYCIRNYNYEVIDRSHSNPIYYVEIKQSYIPNRYRQS